MLPAIRLRLLPLSFLQLVSVFWLRCHAALGFSPPESSRWRSKICVRLHGISTTEISGVDVTACSLSHSGQTVRVEVRGGLGGKIPITGWGLVFWHTMLSVHGATLSDTRRPTARRKR